MTPVTRSLVSAAVFAAGLLLVAERGATQTQPLADPDAKTVNLETHLCKDVMRTSGDDRLIALGLLHGYVLGSKGTVKWVSEELGKVTDAFVEHCLSNPNDVALQVLARLAK
jgi:hypothetical protein